jgi:hypothetical protein
MSGLLESDPIHFTDLQHSGRVLPGDHIILLDGTYTGDWECEWSGTLADPIIINPKNINKVTIDGSLIVNEYTHWYDIDFTDSRTDRYIPTVGINATGPGIEYHGCRICDLHLNGISWFGSGIGEISENVIYNNGDRFPDTSGHGHGVYTHNDIGGARLIARNIIGNQLGNYTIHIYTGSDNFCKDYTIQDNILCGDGYIAGGGDGLWSYLYEHNVHYGFGSDINGQGRYSTLNNDGIIRHNYFVDLGAITIDVTPPWTEGLVEQDNEVYGHTTKDEVGDHFVRAGYTEYDYPATKTWIVPYTESARWLGMVAIFNRDSAATVSVDFSSLLANGNYRLRNGQNMTETWDFTQAGVAINVPMNTWTASHVIGEGDGENHLPVFGAFVIESGDNPIYGDTTWGHKTGVTESNIRSYAVNWTGTGGISGINDAEKIGLHVGEYMDSEVVETGIRTVELLQNNYDPTGDDVNLDYRHGATEVDCLAAAWNDYTVTFVSLGFVQIRLTSTL